MQLEQEFRGDVGGTFQSPFPAAQSSGSSTQVMAEAPGMISEAPDENMLFWGKDLSVEPQLQKTGRWS